MQNNYTTIEQSKRLLELGVPRWTADEYRDEKGYRHSLEGILDVELFFQNFPDYFPCWSVGRLIEIIRICVDDFDIRKIIIETLMIETTDNLDALVELMTADECKSDFDFSKLEV